ncbi:hypothetical protein BaRGS_00004318 [Batillaria attramentaria]|uniref:Uncharacterized protein n=1 Tax=Batillaria attramentaria TaxID=370345 RepID=A0ABD0LY82_9CAEN
MRLRIRGDFNIKRCKVPLVLSEQPFRSPGTESNGPLVIILHPEMRPPHLEDNHCLIPHEEKGGTTGFVTTFNTDINSIQMGALSGRIPSRDDRDRVKTRPKGLESDPGKYPSSREGDAELES